MPNPERKSSPIFTLLLLVAAVPAAAQIANPLPGPQAPITKDKSLPSPDIILGRTQREKSVWLENFIKDHQRQFEVGSLLAIIPTPCEKFAQDNSAISNAKAFCQDVREQYYLVQNDMLKGTNKLEDGWKEELTTVQNRIIADDVHTPVHIAAKSQKSDPLFNQYAASAIGWMVDKSQGIFSREDGVVFQGKNLLQPLQDASTTSIRQDVTNYLAESVSPLAEEAKLVQIAVLDSADKAVNAMSFSYFYLTTAIEEGIQENPTLIIGAAHMENVVSAQLAIGKEAAKSAFTGINPNLLKVEMGRYLARQSSFKQLAE